MKQAFIIFLIKKGLPQPNLRVVKTFFISAVVHSLHQFDVVVQLSPLQIVAAVRPSSIFCDRSVK